MSKRGKKRFWTVLVAAALVATLMISSVVAEEGPFVGSDKLSVETGEDEEVVEEVLIEEDEDEEILVDEMMEETEEVAETEEVVETEEELPTGEVTEEADADASEPTEGGAEDEPEIQTMSVEGEIKPFAADDVLLLDASGNQVGAYETVSDALNAAGEGYTIQLNADVYETMSVKDGAVVTLDLNGHTISANGAGSTVVAANGSGTELTIMDSTGTNSGTITGGAPSNGGGVELSGGAVVNFQSGTISGNTASANTRAGAGVHFDSDGGTFNMSGGVISDNTAVTANGSGGGVCVNNGGVFNMTGGTITGNQTSSGGNGGGVYVYNGSFNMSAGTISGNTAGGYGGAVNVAAGCTFTMTGGTITDNTASDGGGAVAVRGTGDASRTVFTMSGGTISLNNTSGTGGAIYVDDTTVNIESNAVITGNGTNGTVTTTNGGGIYVTSSGILNLTGGTISNNSATLGGGIYNLGSVTMGGGTISGNEATTTTSTTNGGGGILATGSSASLIMSGGTISGNKAASAYGGGVDISSSANFSMSAGEISGNESKSSGGGVHVYNATVTMSGGSISQNTAADGGAVNITNNGTFTMSGGSITGNEASEWGGGVHVWNGSFKMSGSAEISGNSAAVYGGAVNVAQSGKFTMENGTISGNTALSFGGGIYAAGTVTMSGGTIKENTVTAGNGGGVYVASNGTFSMSESTEISGNSALYGGGIYCSGTVTMTGGSISGNKQSEQSSPGGGGVVLDGGTFTMNDGEISGNESIYSGAGVYVKDGTFTLNKGSISNNKSTTYAGGGVCTAANATSTFVMNGGEITGNKAVSGAGVQVCDGSTFTMNGGEISENVASMRGGGVELLQSNCTFNLTGGEITGNQAPTGGGVWFQATGAVMTVSGGSVSGNTDTNGDANNVDLSIGSSAHITLAADLSTVPAKLAEDGSDAKIGVTTATNPTEKNAVQFTTTEDGTEYYATSASYFFSDKGYEVRANAEEKYLELYKVSFEETYLTDEEGDTLYTEATPSNYAQILSGADAWEALSVDEQNAINADLAEASGDPTLDYPTLLAQAQTLLDTANAFIASYVSDNDPDNPYESATMTNFRTILDGEDPWSELSADEQAVVNELLTAAVGKTYEELLLEAEQDVEQLFENDYLRAEEDGDLYIEATKDNYLQILSGADDWELLNDEEKELINADLTAAWQADGGEGELTYPMLLLQAQTFADAAGFEEAYLMADADGNLYTEATKENYEQILAGESDWDALSDEAKAQINADLTNANNGVELTYPMLLAQAQAVADAAGFEEEYLMADADGDLYTAATYSNYAQILSGEDAWEALSDEAKAQINADLTAANGGEELTYPMLLAQAKALADDLGFEEAYLMNDGDGNLYTEATPDNYEQILAGESAWYALTEEEQAQINADLTAANGGEELTYPMLLAQARATGFEETYLTGDDGDLYTEATLENYQQILAGEDAWNALSDEAKAQINADLTAANGGIPLTYEDLLAQAKAYEVAADFVDEYVRGSDGYTYKEATPANYLQILAGEDEWNAMTQAERDAVNAILAANGSPTYEELLAQAKALAAATDEDLSGSGPAKTGDSNTLYLYILLAMAAAAAVAGVAVSRKRPV